LELATKANELTGGKDASVLDALAAAHAEVGDFDKAVEFQKKALADKAFEKDFGEKARARLKQYEQKKPWREGNALRPLTRVSVRWRRPDRTWRLHPDRVAPPCGGTNYADSPSRTASAAPAPTSRRGGHSTGRRSPRD